MALKMDLITCLYKLIERQVEADINENLPTKILRWTGNTPACTGSFHRVSLSGAIGQAVQP
jgi:hypothetical protein